MSRLSPIILVLGLVLLMGVAVQSSQRHPDTHEDLDILDDAGDNSDSNSDSNSQQNNNDFAALMLLMLNGCQFLQCSVLVTTVALLLGIMAARGLHSSSLHN